MVSTPLLARRYDEYRASVNGPPSARQRGKGWTASFMAWLESYWGDDAPPETAGRPAAVSAGGRGTVRWHETGGAIRGYVPDQAGCYEVPRDAAPPARCASTPSASAARPG